MKSKKQKRFKNTILATGQIAEICGVSSTTVRNWLDDGQLKSWRLVGGHRRVWSDDLLEFMKTATMPLDVFEQLIPTE